MGTHLLVGNPTAQSGKNAERIEKARTLLIEADLKPELLATKPAGETIDLVRRRLDAGDCVCVIAMGGDGTFREVASGILGAGAGDTVPLAMLPTGTANDQGRSFGLDASEGSLEANVRVIKDAYETRLDAGHIRAGGTEAYFFDSLGYGISARVLSRRNDDRRLVEELGPLKEFYRDHMVYAGAFLRTFLESYVVDDKFDVECTIDGKTVRIDGLTDLVLKATRIYAGAWVFDPSSAHDDGAFELVPFRGKRDWASKAMVEFDGSPVTPELLSQIGVEHSRPLRGSRFYLRLSPHAGGLPLAAQMDGEEFHAYNEIEIDVLKQALRLIIPKAHS